MIRNWVYHVLKDPWFKMFAMQISLCIICRASSKRGVKKDWVSRKQISKWRVKEIKVTGVITISQSLDRRVTALTCKKVMSVVLCSLYFWACEVKQEREYVSTNVIKLLCWDESHWFSSCVLVHRSVNSCCQIFFSHVWYRKVKLKVMYSGAVKAR